MANFSKNTGFTLVEFLVVIGILSILVIIALAALNPQAQLRKARDTKRKSDLREIKTSLVLYRNICNSYPQSNGGGQIVGCGASCASVASCPWGQPWSVSNTTIMKILPADPNSAQNYSYYHDEAVDQDQLRLWAILENPNDNAGQESRARCVWDDGDPATNDYVVCED